MIVFFPSFRQFSGKIQISLRLLRSPTCDMDEKRSSSSGTNEVAVTDVAVNDVSLAPGMVPGYIKPQGRMPHDPAVKFEEYHYYAQRTRQEEMTLESPVVNWRQILLRKKNGAGSDEKLPESHLTEADFATAANRLEISDEEWTNASRAFRTASWGACELKL